MIAVWWSPWHEPVKPVWPALTVVHISDLVAFPGLRIGMGVELAEATEIIASR